MEEKGAEEPHRLFKEFSMLQNQTVNSGEAVFHERIIHCQTWHLQLEMEAQTKTGVAVISVGLGRQLVF